jgi:PPOX class probable F420-dependent enzyme
MGEALSELGRRLLDAPTFAVVSTVDRDGSPHSTVVWVKRDGDDVIFSTLASRQKARNLRRDPRATVTMFDPTEPLLYTSISGTVTMTEEGGRALIDELSVKYTGSPFRQEPPEHVRVVCRLTPSRVVGR